MSTLTLSKKICNFWHGDFQALSMSAILHICSYSRYVKRVFEMMSHRTRYDEGCGSISKIQWICPRERKMVVSLWTATVKWVPFLHFKISKKSKNSFAASNSPGKRICIIHWEIMIVPPSRRSRHYHHHHHRCSSQSTSSSMNENPNERRTFRNARISLESLT